MRVRFDSDSDDGETVVNNDNVYASVSDDEERGSGSDSDEEDIGGPRDSAIFGDADDLRGVGPTQTVGPIKCATAAEMLMPDVTKRKKSKNGEEDPQKKTSKTPAQIYEEALQYDANRGWKQVDNDQGPAEVGFVGTPGMLPVPAGNEDALFYLDLMCKREEYSILARETNAYAERKRVGLEEGESVLHYLFYQKHLRKNPGTNTSNVIQSKCNTIQKVKVMRGQHKSSRVQEVSNNAISSAQIFMELLTMFLRAPSSACCSCPV